MHSSKLGEKNQNKKKKKLHNLKIMAQTQLTWSKNNYPHKLSKSPDH